MTSRESSCLFVANIPFLMTLFLIALLGIAVVYFVNSEGASQ